MHPSGLGGRAAAGWLLPGLAAPRAGRSLGWPLPGLAAPPGWPPPGWPPTPGRLGTGPLSPIAGWQWLMPGRARAGASSAQAPTGRAATAGPPGHRPAEPDARLSVPDAGQDQGGVVFAALVQG